MSVITGTIRARATVEAGITPKVYNVAANIADTEYSQTLSSGVKSFMIRVRGSARLQLAFVSGDSSLAYITVSSGCSFTQDLLSFSGTLYFQTNKPTQIVEILEWV